jgi:hypothetical protein
MFYTRHVSSKAINWKTYQAQWVLTLERVTDKWRPVIGPMTRLDIELECGFDSIKT